MSVQWGGSGASSEILSNRMHPIKLPPLLLYSALIGGLLLSYLFIYFSHFQAPVTISLRVAAFCAPLWENCHVFDSRSKPNQKECSWSIIMSYMSLHTVGMRMRPETRWPGTQPPTDYLRCDALTANCVRHHCNLSAALTVLWEA